MTLLDKQADSFKHAGKGLDIFYRTIFLVLTCTAALFLSVYAVVKFCIWLF